MPKQAPIHRSPLQPTAKHAKRSRERRYDQRRGTAAERGYTYAWSKAAKAYRERNPLCIGCKAAGWVVPATLVDHIVPHRGDHELMWSEDNWQPLCAWHHDTVKQRLELMFDRGEVPSSALRLNSQAAIDLTLKLKPPRG